jgi:hypothetical protein
MWIRLSSTLTNETRSSSQAQPSEPAYKPKTNSQKQEDKSALSEATRGKMANGPTVNKKNNPRTNNSLQ